MASIPLPALDVKPPAPQANPLEQYQHLMALKQMQTNAPLQTQLLQQQVQEGQQNMQARQALNQAFQGAVTKDENGQAKFDPDKLQQNLASGPAAYKTPEVMEGVTKFMTSKADLQQKMMTIQQTSSDMLGSAASAIKAANYDPTLAHSLLDTLPPSPQTNQLRQQIDNPQALKQMVDTAIQNSPKQRELAATETTAAARKQTAQADADKLAASQNPQSSLYAPSPASVALGTAPGAQQIQAGKQQQAAAVAGADAKARMPYEMALAAQKQALSQGDPKMAGHLMASGDATLSELKARGATPDFIARSLFAAKQENPNFNPQEAEAQFDVAKSPTNTGFFGSAGSLVSKGGTLDQLQNVAKSIPQNQIPALNTLEDWTKAAGGNGPLAHYASTALGVADDYSKVMGGGQGSDTSRLAALNLINKNASPEARAGAIEGIRDAVGSQMESRIGKNPVLQRMYGSQLPAKAAAAGIGMGSVITQNGHQYKVTAVDKNGKPTSADPVQ